MENLHKFYYFIKIIRIYHHYQLLLFNNHKLHLVVFATFKSKKCQFDYIKLD